MKLTNTWKEILEGEFEKKYFKQLKQFLEIEYSKKTVYPSLNNVFNSLNYTDYKDVKVVILGQDPYHGKNQANGLAFSVNEGVKIPPSLNNIFKELNNDLGINIPNHGNLKSWTKEGVLLLNTSLTVEEGKPDSHRDKGWEIFTDKIIMKLNDKDQSIIFVLWGNKAKEKKKLIDDSKHYIIESYHPSPLSANRGFFGSRPFSKINNILKKEGKKTINWEIENI